METEFSYSSLIKHSAPHQDSSLSQYLKQNTNTVHQLLPPN